MAFCRWAVIGILGVVLTVISLPPANAQRPDRPGRTDSRSAPAVSISADRAAAIARAAAGGRVLGVSLKAGRRPVYRVRLLVAGKRVRTVRVDARTGAVID